MWPWQLKKWPKRYFYLFRLFVVSAVLHFVLLAGISFFRLCKSRPYQLTINANALSSNVQVVFLPLYKKVNKKPVVLAQASAKKQLQRKEEKKVNNFKKKQQSKPETKQKPKVTVESGKKKIIIKKAPPKKIEKTKNKKLVSKNKNTTHKQAKEVKGKASASPQKLYVGRQGLALLQMQARIEKEVSVVWKPPAGLPKELICQVTLTIDARGNVAKAIVNKSSGVLLYDVSARTALAQLKLPTWANNKEFCITFKQ